MLFPPVEVCVRIASLILLIGAVFVHQALVMEWYDNLVTSWFS